MMSSVASGVGLEVICLPDVANSSSRWPPEAESGSALLPVGDSWGSQFRLNGDPTITYLHYGLFGFPVAPKVPSFQEPQMKPASGSKPKTLGSL